MTQVSSTSLARPVLPFQVRLVNRLARFPWWMLLIGLAGVIVFFNIATNEVYSTIFVRIRRGIGITIFVTLVAYSAAILIGLLIGLGRLSTNPIIYNLATLYVQVIRGIPILVQIFVVAFVLTPEFFKLVNAIGGLLSPVLGPENTLMRVNTQNVSLLARAIIALSVAYGGYEAETFRAGIQSIGRGQMEAARSLGMSYFQALRFIILPQAIRRVLPPLGNDFISMLKDSSLVSVLGVRDITQEARLYVSASFLYPETYYTLAVTYLTMTITLALAVRWLEKHLGKAGREA